MVAHRSTPQYQYQYQQQQQQQWHQQRGFATGI
jgi:hypothetical protein